MTDDTNIHSFVHCKACVTRGQKNGLEVGVSRTGLVVKCKRHGIVVHLSPEQLNDQLSRGPQCACCPGGMHRS